MPKKRRKLNKEMEAEMAAAKRKIELNMALSMTSGMKTSRVNIWRPSDRSVPPL